MCIWESHRAMRPSWMHGRDYLFAVIYVDARDEKRLISYRFYYVRACTILIFRVDRTQVIYDSRRIRLEDCSWDRRAFYDAFAFSVWSLVDWLIFNYRAYEMGISCERRRECNFRILHCSSTWLRNIANTPQCEIVEVFVWIVIWYCICNCT